MALSIKDVETDRLVRRYAQLKGVSYTRAIRVAVSDALDREKVPAEPGSFLERARRIQGMVAKFEVLDDRTPEDIIGYDENGLPS